MLSLLTLLAETPIRLPANRQANERDSGSDQYADESNERRQHPSTPAARCHGFSTSGDALAAMSITKAIQPRAHFLSPDCITPPTPGPRRLRLGYHPFSGHDVSCRPEPPTPEPPKPEARPPCGT